MPPQIILAQTSKYFSTHLPYCSNPDFRTATNRSHVFCLHSVRHCTLEQADFGLNAQPEEYKLISGQAASVSLRPQYGARQRAVSGILQRAVPKLKQTLYRVSFSASTVWLGSPFRSAQSHALPHAPPGSLA
jgi:hypothetical protein